MAAGVLGRPGTSRGPCEQACAHADCTEIRRIAESRCRHCKEPIGYGRAFYRHPKGWTHADCSPRSGGLVYGGHGYQEEYG